ncbi:MAG TPA: glycosyltransferase family 4 protein [Allosphingosinicella sp.]|jgi:glycosyltransferase involved in cell wall biosynthesis
MDSVRQGKVILVLASYAPSLINFRGPLIAALIERGHKVIAVAPDIDAATQTALSGLGARAVSLKLSNASLNPLALLASYRELARLLRKVRPDVVFSYTIKPVILGALAGRAAGVRQIVSLITGLGYAFASAGDGGGVGRRVVRAVAAALYRRALARSDLVIFQNPDDRRDMQDMGLLAPDAATALVNGSGVDVEHFAPVPLPARPSFLMIARLLRDKGIREFAAAAERLRREHPETPVALAGYLDPSPDSLTQRELDALVAAGIRFHGKLEDVRPAIAACSVYVLPSYREGTPRSVLEAMAMGRAIVTTDTAGCRETVVDGVNGFLVPTRDAHTLYSAMERFVTQPGLAARMGAESRRMAERRFDAREVSAEIIRRMEL